MSEYADALQEGWIAAAILGVPLLLIAGLSGFAFALFQAVTQIQDQALPQIVKFMLVFGAIALFGAVLSAPLLTFTQKMFSASGF